MENIGGIVGKQEFNFEKGINTLTAPNATGKTSFVKGLRATIIPREELRTYRHFLNIWSLEGYASIIVDGKEYTRKLASTNGELSVSGNPFFENGLTADVFAIATPDNRLLELIQAGKSLAPIIEELSGAKYHRILVEWLRNRHRRVREELNEKQRRLDELQRLQGESTKEKTQLTSFEKELASLPPLTEGDKERYAKYRSTRTKVTEASRLHKKNAEDLGFKREQYRNLSESIKNFEQKHPDVNNEIEELEDLLSAKNNEYSKLMDMINFTNMEIDITRQAREECIMHMDKLPEKAPYCFACGRPLESVEQLEKRLTSLEKAKIVHQETYSELQKETGEIEEKTSWLRNQKMEILVTEVNLRDKVEQRIKFLESEKKELEQTLKSASTQLKALASVPKHVDKYTQLEADILAQKSIIKRIERNIEDLGTIGVEYQTLSRKESFVRHAIAYMEKRAEETMRNYIATFNKRIMEVCRILGFKDFHDIRINDMLWTVEVERESGVQRKPVTLDYLSASERTTLGITLILAGKLQYVPDFPMFVLDELTLSYDPTRFKRILEYLKEVVPYVIVTALSPLEEGEQIRVTIA